MSGDLNVGIIGWLNPLSELVLLNNGEFRLLSKFGII